jgi:exonuclease III
MTSEGDTQEMLFAGVEDHTQPAETGTLRLCAVNGNGAGQARSEGLLGWLLGTCANALIVTELRQDGGRFLMSALRAEGFTVHAGHEWRTARHFTLAASYGFETAVVEPEPFDPRIVAVDLTPPSATVSLRLVGVYGPTNGMTDESSAKRRVFQARLLRYLRDIATPRMCVAGDLNVVEPGHVPPLPAFRQHDYDFYDGLIGLGMLDAYRLMNPTGGHSWFSDRFGAQRLDHAMLTPGVGFVDACNYDQGPRRSGYTDHAALLATIHLATAP